MTTLAAYLTNGPLDGTTFNVETPSLTIYIRHKGHRLPYQLSTLKPLVYIYSPHKKN